MHPLASFGGPCLLVDLHRCHLIFLVLFALCHVFSFGRRHGPLVVVGGKSFLAQRACPAPQVLREVFRRLHGAVKDPDAPSRLFLPIFQESSGLLFYCDLLKLGLLRIGNLCKIAKIVVDIVRGFLRVLVSFHLIDIIVLSFLFLVLGFVFILVDLVVVCNFMK